MVCSYCLQRDAVLSRRCQPCADYLDQLHSSDDEDDVMYGVLLRWRAGMYYTDRLRGGERRAA